ncbi:hypothetical protein H2203_008536 [Taxawa tesnikishii (nom. ined.)]|nr:hypothetical protein H2203_008536 [Dothideales sp. JES 119]
MDTAASVAENNEQTTSTEGLMEHFNDRLSGQEEVRSDIRRLGRGLLQYDKGELSPRNCLVMLEHVASSSIDREVWMYALKSVERVWAAEHNDGLIDESWIDKYCKRGID